MGYFCVDGQLSNLFIPFQQINGLVGPKLDVADEFMNDPSDASSDEVESRGKEDAADENSDDAAAATNAKKVRVKNKSYRTHGIFKNEIERFSSRCSIFYDSMSYLTRALRETQGW